MKVACIVNSGAQLGESYFLLGSAQSLATLTIGREYTVVAMELLESRIKLLVSDDYDQPMWYPVELFEIKDFRLPPEWCFAVNPCPNQPMVKALWGYELLILDPHHNEALIERDPSALNIFKNEMDFLVDGEDR